MMQNLKRNVQNWHEGFVEVWPELSKNWTLMVSNVWAQKYRGVMFDGTEYWCKSWRKTDLCFQKWHEEFGRFSFTGWKIAISF